MKTQTELRIAIAEACGWTPGPFGYYVKDPAGLTGPRDRLDEMPDYPNDLNAMHEAEKVLKAKGRNAWEKYGEKLQDAVNYYVVGYVCDYPYSLGSLASIASATAAQRAEAFVATIENQTK